MQTTERRERRQGRECICGGFAWVREGASFLLRPVARKPVVEMVNAGVWKGPAQGPSSRLMASVFWAEVGRREPGGGG